MHPSFARLASRVASALEGLFASHPRTPGGGLRIEAPRRLALA